MSTPTAVSESQVAGQLLRLGLRAGDEIATVGPAFDAYYARLAGLRVAANIGFSRDNRKLEADRFWSLGDGEFTALVDDLRRVGVKAIVSPAGCRSAPGQARPGWTSLGNSGFCVYLLN